MRAWLRDEDEGDAWASAGRSLAYTHRARQQTAPSTHHFAHCRHRESRASAHGATAGIYYTSAQYAFAQIDASVLSTTQVLAENGRPDVRGIYAVKLLHDTWTRRIPISSALLTPPEDFIGGADAAAYAPSARQMMRHRQYRQ